MISSRQQAYLDAMGIEVWSLRDVPPSGDDHAVAPPAAMGNDSAVQASIVKDSETQSSSMMNDAVTQSTIGLKLGSGSGGILLICSKDVDSAGRLSNDICRAMGHAPVWGWPDEASDSVPLATAVEDNLYTTVAIFGQPLASRFFAQEIPANLSSANLVLLPSMDDIQTSADARKSLWAVICRSGMVSKN